MSIGAVILGAGLGKRMKSSLPKVLHEAAGKPLISWVAEAARSAGADSLVAVVGPEMSDEDRARHLDGFSIAVQTERLGTGHAMMTAMPLIARDVDEVLVLCGDVPCIRHETLRRLIDSRREAAAAASVLTMLLDDPFGYGRIVRDGGASGMVTKIVEERDASEKEKQIREVNSGIYSFGFALLSSGLKSLRNDNAQKEYYLTDVVRHCFEQGEGVTGVVAEDADELLGVNTPDQLAVVDQILARRIGKA